MKLTINYQTSLERELMKMKIVVAFFNIFQLATLGICLYGFTSTMVISPWYDPLTMGAFFLVFIMAAIQGFVTICFLYLYTERGILKINTTLSLLNLMLLLIIIFISTIIKEELFYNLAYIAAVTEIVLSIIHIYVSVFNIRKIS